MGNDLPRDGLKASVPGFPAVTGESGGDRMNPAAGTRLRNANTARIQRRERDCVMPYAIVQFRICPCKRLLWALLYGF